MNSGRIRRDTSYSVRMREMRTRITSMFNIGNGSHFLPRWPHVSLGSKFPVSSHMPINSDIIKNKLVKRLLRKSGERNSHNYAQALTFSIDFILIY